MRSFLGKLLSEPYIHFLLAGLLIYFWHTIASDDLKSQISTKEVTLSISQKEKLSQSFEREWGRRPKPEELKLLLDEAFLEEMLIDEALALNMERHDATIRKRLLEKMRFILANTQSLEEPNETDLRNYYQTHREDYRNPQSVHFFHIYAPLEQEAALAKMIKLLDTNDTPPEKAFQYGEKFTLGNEIGPMDIETLEKLFGNYFSRKLIRLRSGIWQGPIRSKKGVHAVYLLDKKAGSYIPFEEVEDRVYQDMLQERRREMVMHALGKIRRSFHKRIE